MNNNRRLKTRKFNTIINKDYTKKIKMYWKINLLSPNIKLFLNLNL